MARHRTQAPPQRLIIDAAGAEVSVPAVVVAETGDLGDLVALAAAHREVVIQPL